MLNLSGNTYTKYLLLMTAILYTTSGLFAYYMIISYDSNRIYNPRKVSKEYRVEVRNGRRFAVAKAPSGIEAWRILGKA